MKKYLLLGLLALGACTTTPTGAKVVNPNVIASIQSGAQALCAIAPTASTITNLYTNNADVKSTEAAVALACAMAVPGSVVPAAVTPAIVNP